MFLVAVCVLVSGLLWAASRRFLAQPVGLADRGLSFGELMEEWRPRQGLADKQLKEQFLDALRANNAREVMRVLHTGKLDIDTVMEVDDPSMVLASYKQGKGTRPMNALLYLGLLRWVNEGGTTQNLKVVTESTTRWSYYREYSAEQLN